MRLLFLGTAAAEGYPGIFCNCENCQEARRLGGKSIRMRSALLVNDDLLIDFGPDLGAAAQRFSRSLALVTIGLLTHAHPDHFYLENFHMRKFDFTGELPIPTLRLFGPRDALDILAEAAGFPPGNPEGILAGSPTTDLSIFRVEAHLVKAFDAWTDGGYTFTAYRAYHAVPYLEPLFYSVDDGKHAFLYATDTGRFPEDTWEALAGRSFDAIILEETMGTGTYDQHMGFETFLEHARRMRAEGMLRPGGRLIAHHMSHTHNPTHEKVEAILGPHGVEVAYDGMEVVL